MGRTMAGFSLDRIAEALPAMQEAARRPRRSRSRRRSAVRHSVLARPTRSVHEKRSRRWRTQPACPVVLMGAAMLDALDDLGARSIAIAGGYYTPGDWTSMAMARLRVQRLRCRLPRRVGSSRASWLRSRSPTGIAWEQAPGVTKAHVLRTAERAGHSVDAIVVCGGGLRLFGHAAELEAATGLPVVAGDLALFRATLKAMDAKPRSAGWGRLLDGL